MKNPLADVAELVARVNSCNMIELSVKSVYVYIYAHTRKYITTTTSTVNTTSYNYMTFRKFSRI